MPIDISVLPTYTISESMLVALSEETLINLLQHRTKLLLAAIKVELPEKGYISQLREEITALQAEINRRTGMDII